MKKIYLKWGLVGLVSLLFLTGVGLFLFRGTLLRSVAREKVENLSRRYGLQVSYASLTMPSVATVRIEGLSVVPNGCDTLFRLRDMNVDLALWPMFSGKVSVRGITADGLQLTFVKQGAQSNYDFLFRGSVKSERVKSAQKGGYDERVEKVFDVLFRLLPDNASLRNLSVEGKRDSLSTRFTVPLLQIANRSFDTSVRVSEGDLQTDWRVKGILNSAERKVEGEISSGRRVVLPYIRSHYQAFVGFDKVAFRLSQHTSGKEQVLDGDASVRGLEVYHKGLSPDTICLDRGEFDYKLRIGRNYAELDSASRVVFNQLEFNPYLRAAKEKRWHVIASIHRADFPAQRLFASLPSALFRHVQGIQTEGDLSYDFLLDVDFNRLDSLRFHSDLRGHRFRIRNFGGSNLAKMSGEFEYTAYDGDCPVRTFAVGPSNPSFRSLDRISPLLREAIMQSEDGHFYYHQGFYPGAIQEALIYDLKVGRFARGGSSITMQLVKNVFLNKHKNIARKLEEALIVWLIESQHLTSKDRMYEVYLNIAEWGPRVYGASEASHFYFNKEPSDLTMEEAIFMASIIPRPKHFYWSFNPDGTLRESQGGYFRQIARRLAIKGLITEGQAESVLPNVELKGVARDQIVRPDTAVVVVDSTGVENRY